MKPLVVIPAFSRDAGDVAMLDKCLSSLRRTVKDACDVLVVDDGSPDADAREATRRLTEQAGGSFYSKEENAGFSSAVNIGLRQALRESRDAVLVNADVEFITSTWLELMLKQPASDGDGLASVVGALLLYPNMTIQHAGVYFCSPADEQVLTASDGYVALRDLDPDTHGLVSYSRKEDRIFRGATAAGRWKTDSIRPRGGGYGFDIEHHPYAGLLLAVETQNGTAHVTPNHRFTAFWTEEALVQWCVYVMRRGNDWRVGHTKVRHGQAFGPRLRMDQQGADAIWILGIYPSKAEAIAQESLLAWTYRVPTLQFRLSADAGVTQEQQDDTWAQLESYRGASALLDEFGRDPSLPLMVGRKPGDPRRAALVGATRRYEVCAANLIPGKMLMPTDPGAGQTPHRLPFTMSTQFYRGDVYSMNVDPHEHYVSNGVITHNSLLYREFDHIYRYGPHNLPEARDAKVCPVTGALQFIRYECIANVGVYDETFRMGWEDVDYCVRVWQSGRECIYQPGVRAIHHEGFFRGTQRKSPQLEQWQAASWERFKQKWGDVSFSEFVPSLI